VDKLLRPLTLSVVSVTDCSRNHNCEYSPAKREFFFCLCSQSAVSYFLLNSHFNFTPSPALSLVDCRAVGDRTHNEEGQNGRPERESHLPLRQELHFS
jgi:hypothetical protein